MKKIFVFIFSLLLLSSLYAETITLATLDWEPYIGKNLKNQGYVAELVKEAFKREGYDVKYVFLPWARVIVTAKAGKYDGYFPEYYSDEVAEEFIFSDKFQGGPLGFFTQSDSDISYEKLEDLKNYKIGVVRGYINTPEFDNADFLKKEAAKDDLTNIKKLLNGRINLMVADKFVGSYILQNSFPKNINDLKFISPPLAVPDLYICFSKKLTNSEKYNSAFNKGLKSITEDGTFDKILKSHGF